MNKMELAANGLFSLLRFLFPVLFVLAIIYVIHVRQVYNHADKTVNDVRDIVQIFSTAFPSGNYRGLNTDAVVLGGNLPLEVRSKFVDTDYKIHNRFGGRVYFYESLGNTIERADYFTYGGDIKLYQRINTSIFVVFIVGFLKTFK